MVYNPSVGYVVIFTRKKEEQQMSIFDWVLTQDVGFIMF